MDEIKFKKKNMEMHVKVIWTFELLSYWLSVELIFLWYMETYRDLIRSKLYGYKPIEYSSLFNEYFSPNNFYIIWNRAY